MTQEERQIFEEDLKKMRKGFIGIMLLFAFILLFIMNCNNNKYNQLKGEYKILNSTYENQKKEVSHFEETRRKERDSLNGEIRRREMENKKIVSDNKKIISQIQNIEKKQITVPKDIVGLTKYFNERYNTKENSVVEDKVGLTETTAYDVSYELEEGDRVKEILPLKDKLIDNQNTQITNLEKDKKDTETKLVSAELDIQKQKDLNNSANNNIQNLEKQVSKLQTKSTLTKILIPASFVLGGYLGFQIAK